MGRKGTVYRCIRKKRYAANLKNANEARKSLKHYNLENSINVKDKHNVDIIQASSSSQVETIPNSEIPSSFMKNLNIIPNYQLVSLDEIDNMSMTIERDLQDNNEVDQVVQGRRIIHFQFFMDQIFDIEKHGEKFGCNLSNLKLLQEKQNGLISKFSFKCRMCGTSFQLKTCNESALQLDVNAEAVSGAMLIGIGLSNITKQEQEAAIARGHVNNAGIAMVAVEADACWSKRSYKTNYSALSGCAAIIGEHTGKVLHIGVRNKYCVICARAYTKSVPPRKHNCTKNHFGSSTSMEQAILVDGFNCSIQKRKLIYNILIADGDSSTYKSILESRPYPDVPVQKIECTNHLLRNYNGKNMQLLKDTTIPLIERRHLTGDRLTRLRTAIRSASTFRNKENNSTETKIHNLQKDILNSTRHIFGDHAHCEDYYCTLERKKEQNMVPMIPTLILKLQRNASVLAFHSRSLLQNFTNNRAEQFNSIVAKAVGGKRVNYSLKRSYEARCYAAVVAFNSGKPQYTLYKTLWGKSPGKAIKDLELKRRANNTTRPKRSKTKLHFNKTDGHYGSECQRPDMDQADYSNAKDLFLNNLKQQTLNRFEIERSTILQAESSLWVELRRCILTASNFGKVCKRRANQNSAPLVKTILYSYNIGHVPAIRHGKENEAKALEQMSVQEKIVINKCGLFIDQQYYFLGASPDGICEEGLIEIKINYCPSSAFGIDPEEAVQRKKINCFKLGNFGELTMNSKHDWYYQIQGQLHIANRNVCLFGVWTGSNYALKVVRVHRDKHFWENQMLPKLTHFYDTCILPEIIDSRKARSMPLRQIFL